MGHHRNLESLSAETGNPGDGAIDLRDLLHYNDREFVVTAYRCILGREPDRAGLEHYLSSLREEKATRVEVLAKIRFSTEGRSRRLKIKGLLAALTWQMIRRAPHYAHSFAFRSHAPAAHAVQLDQNLSATLAKLSEFASAIEVLKDVAAGLREVRRSEGEMLKDLRHFDARLRELESRVAKREQLLSDTAELREIVDRMQRDVTIQLERVRVELLS